MACPTSTQAQKQLEGVPNGPHNSTTPGRYSHLLTYSPATFRDLPTEVCWIVWDAMIDQTALLWSYYDPWEAHELESQKLSAAKHYENRVVPFLILSQLNRESRFWVLKRFQLVTLPPSEGFRGFYYLPSHFSELRGPMRCVFGIKIDALRMSSMDIQEKVSRHPLHDEYLFPSWPTTVENMVIDISLLEEFLDFGVHQFPSLKNIYLNMMNLDLPIRFLEEAPNPPLPQFPSRRNADELAVQIAGWTSKPYPSSLVWIDEVENAKRVSRVMTIPGWSKPMSSLWPALKRHRWTCVFIFLDTGIDPEDWQPVIRLFSASHRPEALEQEDHSALQE
ncbi:hypothetical protein F5Y01DRAFT_158124 [Xylaria sp. FL0043]|nr:hypothetical protein F5Y01DRAFT_158124 [Xylaria sp. FL0043]